MAFLFHNAYVLRILSSCFPIGAEVDERLAELDGLVGKLKGLALEESTKRSYQTHRKAYLDFCALYALNPVPVSVQQATRYAAYLSKRLAPQSIPKYLNILRVLHLEAGLPDPQVMQMFELKSVLTGYEKLRGLTVHRVTPITPALLLALRGTIDFTTVGGACMWAACLVGFYGLLRKSNLFPSCLKSFNPEKQLTKSDICSTPWGVEIVVRWTKTVQKKEYVLKVPLLAMPGHPLCPVAAVRAVFILTRAMPMDGPVFYREDKKLGLTPILYKWFLNELRGLLKGLGHDPSEFGSHSFRRGGASWALHCGLQSDVIKVLGDWKSQAYQAYLEIPVDQKLQYMRQFSSLIPGE